MFDSCGDPSYANAVKSGITLGFSQNPPEAWLDEKTKQPNGIDWDINKAALDWMGVKTVKLEWMPWETQIPALLSKRTDVYAAYMYDKNDEEGVEWNSGNTFAVGVRHRF